MRTLRLFLALMFAPLGAFALQQSPWLSNSLELQWHLDGWYQHYSRVQSKQGSVNRKSDDFFLNTSLELSAFDFSGEIEFGASKTYCHNFASDHYAGQFRYQWLDDILYDPISLVTGLSLTHVCASARHDISEFYHGTTIAEVYASFGKEESCRQYWQKRWWGLFAFGLGDHGTGYVRADFNFEKNYYDICFVQYFVRSLWGLGTKKLNLEKPFPGYGLINHQTIDVGAAYGRRFDNCGSLAFSYAVRLYARNAPQYAQVMQLNFVYPFGL